MIYLHHDFFSNFSSAVGSDGNTFTIDLFANEISDMLVNEPEKLVDTLSKTGVPVNIKMSDEEIVDNIISKISDEKTIKALGFAIAESNGLINNGKGKQADWTKAIDSIVIGLTPAVKDITASDATKDSTKQKIMQQIVTKAKMSGDYKRPIWIKDISGSSSAIWWILGFVAVATATYFIYNGVKGKSSGIPAPPLNPLPTT